MKNVSVTEARNNLQEVIDHVHYTGDPLLISKNGKPWVLVHPLPEDDADLGKAARQSSGKRRKRS